jgi:hypothetical protein
MKRRANPRTFMRAAAKPRLEERAREHEREAESVKLRMPRWFNEAEARPLRWRGRRTAKRSASGEGAVSGKPGA